MANARPWVLFASLATDATDFWLMNRGDFDDESEQIDWRDRKAPSFPA